MIKKREPVSTTNSPDVQFVDGRVGFLPQSISDLDVGAAFFGSMIAETAIQVACGIYSEKPSALTIAYEILVAHLPDMAMYEKPLAAKKLRPEYNLALGYAKDAEHIELLPSTLTLRLKHFLVDSMDVKVKPHERKEIREIISRRFAANITHDLMKHEYSKKDAIGYLLSLADVSVLPPLVALPARTKWHRDIKIETNMCLSALETYREGRAGRGTIPFDPFDVNDAIGAESNLFREKSYDSR